jgi:DNA-binding NtrC family response regulator
MLLPGLVGDAPLWQRACRAVEAAVTSGDWVAVEGEAGVGKCALLRAVQVRRQPPRRFTVLDAADAATDPVWMTAVRRALTEDASVVVAHVDVLDGRAARTLAAALQEAERVPASLRTQVAVTTRPGPTRDDLGRLMSLFPTTVSVPPLRLRVADLAALVPFMLGRHGPGGHLTCSPEAMRLLLRYSWPGNVRQLEDLLHQMVQQRRAGQIEAKDLPP